MKIVERVSVSPERWKALKEAKREFENNKEFREFLDKDWELRLKSAEVKKKRPRIKTRSTSVEPAKPTRITIELGGWGLRKTIPMAEYEKEWQGKPGIKVIITF